MTILPNSHYPTHFATKGWENVTFELGSVRVNDGSTCSWFTQRRIGRARGKGEGGERSRFRYLGKNNHVNELFRVSHILRIRLVIFFGAGITGAKETDEWEVEWENKKVGSQTERLTNSQTRTKERTERQTARRTQRQGSCPNVECADTMTIVQQIMANLTSVWTM